MKPGSYTLGPDSTIEVHLVLGPDAGAMAIGTHVSVTLTVAAGSEEPQEVVVDVYSPRQPIDDVGSCALAASTRREDTWTHLVYMHADNDLESPMLGDVKEMADAFKDDDGAVPLNLIVLLDRAHDDGRIKRTDGAYDPQIAYSKTDETPLGNIVTCDGTVYPGTPSGSMLLQLVAPAADGESGRWLLLERTPEKNMDDPSTLSSFIAKGIGNFKADKYMVNLNDHGGSWTGFGGDYSHMIDHLGNVGADNGAEANSFFYLDAMRDAIKAGMAAGFTQQGDPTPETRKVDIIGFDACLMSEYAVIKTLGPMAHYFLASEENEPGHGWDYAYLKPVDGGGVATSAYEYGKAIIEGFMLHRQSVLGGDSSYITTPPLTLTLTNMKSFHVFDEKMKEVSWILQKMMLVPMAEALELVQSVRATTYAWEGVWENDDLSRDGVEVSLRKFLEKLGTGATSTFCAAYESPVRAELFNAVVEAIAAYDLAVRAGWEEGDVPADAGYYFVENHNKGNNKGMGLYFPKYEDWLAQDSRNYPPFKNPAAIFPIRHPYISNDGANSDTTLANVGAVVTWKRYHEYDLEWAAAMEAMFMATWNEGKCTNGAAYEASTSCDVWSGESAGYCQGGVYRNHIRMVCPKSCGVCGNAFPDAEKVDETGYPVASVACTLSVAGNPTWAQIGV